MEEKLLRPRFQQGGLDVKMAAAPPSTPPSESARLGHRERGRGGRRPGRGRFGGGRGDGGAAAAGEREVRRREGGDGGATGTRLLSADC